MIGIRALDVRGFAAHAIYPTIDAAPQMLRFGPWEVQAAPDAPVVGALRVVAISHGTGGAPWGYVGLARHLAAHGFAVVLITHAGNTRGDDHLANTPQNLADRPRHVRLALDAAFAALPIAGDAAVIGHSMGGYTALAVAGGQPMSLPAETADGVGRPVEVEHDPRVARVALLAPALPWLMAPGALAAVRARVFVRTGERDTMTPPDYVAWVLRDLAGVDRAVVPGAGHFFCMGPMSPHLAGMPPAQDPPGFDRAAYLPALYAELTAFLAAR